MYQGSHKLQCIMHTRIHRTFQYSPQTNGYYLGTYKVLFTIYHPNFDIYNKGHKNPGFT